MKRTVSVLLAALLIFAAAGALGEEGTEKRYVRITVRDYGDLYAELYPEIAPITVDNFMKLVNEGFYDGLTFHRIISGFMIQGGDPLGNGTGGSRQTIRGEFAQNGVDNPLKHERGVLSMARSANMDSASSQFFIMHAAASHLDGNYAAFGKVLSGMWIVDRLCAVTPVQDRNGTVRKEDQPVISGIRETTREEAERARDAEEANGKAGTVYVDPLTSVSFRVPEGWNRVSDEYGKLIFVHESDAQKTLTIYRVDQWNSLAPASREQLTAQGIRRADMNTALFTEDSLIRAIGATADAVRRETHGGISYFAAENDAGARWIGADNGYLFVISFSGAAGDPLLGDVTAILDEITAAHPAD